MSEPRMVQCRKLGKLLPGLSRPPYKNELGKRIYEEISKEAWDQWLKESVRYINTYRVDLASPARTTCTRKGTACSARRGLDRPTVVTVARRR